MGVYGAILIVAQRLPILPIANDYLANWAQRNRWGLVWGRRSHRVQGSVITLAGLPDYKLAGLAVRLALNTHTTKTKGFAEAFEQQQTPASKPDSIRI